MRSAGALILAAALACGCKRTIPEREPNEHFTEATAIKPHCAVKGTLSSAADVDIYKIESDRDAGSLALHLGGIRDVDFVISVQDKDRQEIKRFDETGVGGDEEALDLGVDKGVYFLAVSNKNPQAANPTQEYALRVKIEAGAGREREPNDKPLAATALEPGGVLRGHYFPAQNLLAGDTDMIEADWYRINVAKPGLYLLNVDVSETPKVDPLLEIYDANAYKVKEVGAEGPGAALNLRNFGIKAPAQYALRLLSRNRAANAAVSYEMLTELLPYAGTTEFEPNDQRQDATAFAGGSIAGNIAPAADADWYKITVATDARQLLRLELGALEGMDLQLVLTDELGAALLTIDNAGKEQPELLTGVGLSQGDYFAVVSEKTRKAADNRHSYALAQALTPFQPGLEYEINDSSAAAQLIKVGESVDGFIAPKGDVDWYQLNVYKKGRLAVELTGVLNVSAALSLFDQDDREIASEAAARPGDDIAFEKGLDAGTYWIRIKAAAPEQNNVRDKYTLRLKIR